MPVVAHYLVHLHVGRALSWHIVCYHGTPRVHPGYCDQVTMSRLRYIDLALQSSLTLSGYMP